MRAGDVDTPTFMPVGTQATVKGLSPDEVRETGAQIILNNAYHLYLRPGVDLVERLGGVHKFQGWEGGILTDSGGYQIFSLSALHQISEEGLRFKSHIDGSDHLMTPEKSIDTQQRLGTDILMSFDQPIPWGASRQDTATATARTHRWAERGRIAWRPETGQALFGIVQGGFETDLRVESAETLVGLDFPGYSIGGLSVGEPKEMMWGMLDVTTPYLPEQKPRYLMGVGTPTDLVRGVALGVDMFDCVLPTRNGRNALAFTDFGPLKMRNLKHRCDDRPIDPDCSCPACRHSRGYLRHLFTAHEMLGPILLSAHNITYYQRLMADARGAIESGTFSEFFEAKLDCWRNGQADER
jgi:queuine tRNA-ribosyltransferase